MNNQSFPDKVNPFQKMTLEDKIFNANFNGPLQGSLLGSSNFNFKEKNTEIEMKNTSFLNKKD